MSLQMKKREQEKQRQNGLNDPVTKPANTQQNVNGNSWPVNMQHTNSYPAYAPMTMQPSPSMSSYLQSGKNLIQGQEKEDFMKTVMQQAGLQQNPKKVTETPGWSISTDISQMSYQNPGEPIMMDGSNLPPGSYFDAPVYIDPTTGKTITIDSQQPTAAEMVNVPTDVNASQQSQCINPNCSKCNSSKNSVQGN